MNYQYEINCHSFLSRNNYNFLADICGDCNLINCKCNSLNVILPTDPVSISKNSNDHALLTSLVENDCDYDLSTLFDGSFQTNEIYYNNDYDRETLVDQSISDYDLSTQFEESLETNEFSTNITTENNVHDHNVDEYVHDINISSMRAHSMMNLGLKKKVSKWVI